MISQNFRALAAALLLGSATAVVGSVAPVTVAHAAGVRPEVGKPLQEAISLANGGKGSAAMAKIRQAEGVGGLTAEEKKVISQTKDFVAAKTGAGSADSAVGAKAKFAADYNAGRYSEVIQDAELLKKFGAYDSNSQLIVAQAYYLKGDYKGAIRMLKGLGESDNVLSLLMSAASKVGDSQTERDAAEKLILKGQSKYWPYMLTAAENTRGLKDHQTLDIMRLRLMTGNMRNADDYSLATQLALRFGLGTEAQNIAQKGFEAKALSGDRANRLLNMAKSQAAKDQGSMAGAMKQAQAAKSGDQLIKVGEQLTGQGKPKDAIDAIQAGIKKGVTDKDDAQMRLGQAYLAAGNKSAALKAFNAVDGNDADKTVAHLWAVYARTSK